MVRRLSLILGLAFLMCGCCRGVVYRRSISIMHAPDSDGDVIQRHYSEEWPTRPPKWPLKYTPERREGWQRKKALTSPRVVPLSF